MRSFIYILSGLIMITASCSQPENIASGPKWPENLQLPKAEKLAKEFSEHGSSRYDEYYWLNQRENPKVLEYLRAENTYTDTMLASTRELQETLFNEMKGRIKEKDESVPYKDNGYFYYTRFEEGYQYPLVCRKKETLDAPEEIILNQQEMGKGHSYFAVGSFEVTDDNRVMAFTMDTVSRRLYTIRFKNLENGSYYPESINNVDARGLAWASDNKTFFYLKKDTQTLLEYQLYRHELGTDPSKDVLVYEEKDNQYSLNLNRSRSKKYITLVAHRNQIATEYHLLKAADPSGSLEIFQPRQEGLQYFIEHFEDKFFIRTDLDAPNYRLMQTPENATSKENWKEIIPHRTDAMISGFTVFQDFLVLQEVNQAMNQIRVRKHAGNEEYYIPFDEQVYSAFINQNPEFNTDTLRFSYSSLTTPFSVYDLNMKTREKLLKKETEVIGYNKSYYATERLWATARDGVKVPISIVYKKGMKKNGQNPLLLYGYGSYGYSSFPNFQSPIISLLDRGFIFAIAHIRGGQEMGRKWYDDGKMLSKKNTFHDFIDCGEYLVKEKYTSKRHIYANGGSAGGLLMGAVVNLRPDLFNGVIAEVPFVDVITTMSDPTIPLTTSEYKEWGNPANKEEYEYMKSYSPYDNVEKKEYPNMLVTTGLHDSQVQYFEPAKWVARLREMKTGNNILLFRINMEAGHGGASGRFNYLKEEAVNQAFLLALEGITQ